jgi:hypothetical protein
VTWQHCLEPKKPLEGRAGWDSRPCSTVTGTSLPTAIPPPANSFRKSHSGLVQRLKTVILATWEAEIRRIGLKVGLSKKILQSQPIKTECGVLTQEAWIVGSWSKLARGKRPDPSCKIYKAKGLRDVYLPSFRKVLGLIPAQPEKIIATLFLCGGYWGLNLGLCTWKAGALPLKPHLQSILLWLFWRWGLVNHLPRLAPSWYSPDVSLPSS